jgi:hypothetical protein
MRVAGLNERGETGYWTKPIFAAAWDFKTVPLFLPPDSLLTAAAGVDDGGDNGGGVTGERGAALDARFGGYRWNGGEKEADWEYEIPDFNILEGSCDFRISLRGETCVLTLHPVELWTYLARDYLPGRSGFPKMFLVTLDIPEGAFAGLSEDFARRLREKFSANDKALFQYIIAALPRYLLMQEIDKPNTVWFLTDGKFPANYREFRRTWYVEQYDELVRYLSPELTLGENASLTRERYDELCQKIDDNKAFHRELKTRIKEMRQNVFTALTFNMFYLPLHYSIAFTPLRFLEVPKIRTVTSFGDKIVFANWVYTDAVSEKRTWINERIIRLLETRLACYEDMKKRFDQGARTAAIPDWYSDTMTGYWDIAGLPRKISGHFFTPRGERIPAVLTLARPEGEQAYLGWYIAIGDGAGDAARAGDNVSSFLRDPRKSSNR